MTRKKKILKVSVIIPTNRINYMLLRSIRSCLLQTELPFEIIIVLNNLVMGKKFKDINQMIRTKRVSIKIINAGKNIVAAKARNIGIKKATFSMIAILDSGDEFKKNHLKTALKNLNGKQFKKIYACAYQNIHQNGHIELRTNKYKKISKLDIMTYNPIGHSTVVAHKEIFGLYDEVHKRHDLRKWLELMNERVEFLYNSSPNVIRYLSSKSLSANKLKLVKPHFDAINDKSGILMAIYGTCYCCIIHLLLILRRNLLMSK